MFRLIIALVAPLVLALLVSCQSHSVPDPWLVPDYSSVHHGGQASFTSDWKIAPQDGSVAPVRSPLARTVVAAQSEAGFYKHPHTGKPLNIYLAKDLLLWKGAPESTKERFLKSPFPEGSPYNRPWVYERAFTVSGLDDDSVVWLDLEELNYEAQVVVNGRVIRERIVGPYRRHAIMLEGAGLKRVNTLRIVVTPQPIGALARTWLDWHASPPDKMLGLAVEPKLTVGRRQRIRSIHPVTKLTGGDARMSLQVEVLGDSVADQMLVEIGGGQYLYDLEDVTVRKEEGRADLSVSGIRVQNAQLWWASRMGSPHLYPLKVTLLRGNRVVSERNVKVGLREVESYLDSGKHRRFRLNGQDIRIVGAGWSSDFTLNEPMSEKWKRLKLLQDAGYNAIRQEGTMETAEFYQMTDAMGMMVLAGWACCTQWEAAPDGEMWDVVNPDWVWTAEKYAVAEKSLRDQLLKLRENASFIGWFNGSDYAPHQELERRYKKVYREVLGADWARKIIPRASENARTRKSATFGRSGSQMEGPYEHVVAQYWEDPQSLGFPRGFHSELGPGVSFPSLAALQELSPALNPSSPLFDEDGALLDANLSAHAGHKSFGDLSHFYHALRDRYGAPKDAYDLVRLTQLLNYEDHRAMNQAFAREKQATGHVHWMGMNAWKSLRWNLMFHGSLETGGALAGAKKGNAPLAPIYSHAHKRIEVLNQQSRSLNGLMLDYVVYSATSEEVERKVTDPNGAPLDPARFSAYGDTVVLSLRLMDGDEVVARNTYTLATGQTRLLHEQENWFRTPAEVAPTRGVRQLDNNPAIVKSVRKVGERKYAVTLVNPSATKLSYANLAKAYDQRGAYHAQTWSDNMITLRPAESVEVIVEMLSATSRPQVKVVKH